MAYTNLLNQVRVGVRAGAIIPVTPPLITTNLLMNLDAQYYTSGTWTGTSSTSLNATLTNGVVFSNEIGGCMYFDGYEDYAIIPYNSQFEFTNGTNDLPFTMMGWFRMFDSVGGPLLSKSDNGNNQYLSYTINSSSSGISMTFYNNANGANYGGKVITGSYSLSPETWYHYSITYTGTTASIYINGSTTSISTSTWGTYTRMNPTNIPLYIGSHGTTGMYSVKFRGEIAQQMIYNKALSSSEVYQNYMSTRGRFIVTSLLDIFSGSISAHSIRRVKSSYTGPCIKVRRSSDNSEMDIYFDGSGNLNTSSLLSFVESGDGYVTKWYDQAGSNDMEQPISINQLRIVSSGALETLNGKPALYKSTNSSMSSNFGITYSAPNSIYSVISLTANSGESYITSGSLFRSSFTTGQISLNAGISISFPHTPSILTQGLYSFVLNESLSRAIINNSRGVYGNSGVNSSISNLSIGATGSSQMKIQEIISFDKDQDWNRTRISDKINSYFSTYTKFSEKGLIAYYDGYVPDSYPGSGNIVYDISSYNNNMTLLNGASFQNGGIYFDGINDYCQSSQGISLKEGPKTFVIWMKQTKSSGGQICRIGGASSGQLFELISGASGFEGHFWGTSFGVNAGKTLMNVYTHVAMSYISSKNGNHGKTTIYVDGVEKGSYNSTLLNFNNGLFYLSQPAYSGTSYYNGYMYSVKLYDRALSSNEILGDFNNTKSRFGL